MSDPPLFARASDTSDGSSPQKEIQIAKDELIENLESDKDRTIAEL